MASQCAVVSGRASCSPRPPTDEAGTPDQDRGAHTARQHRFDTPRVTSAEEWARELILPSTFVSRADALPSARRQAVVFGEVGPTTYATCPRENAGFSSPQLYRTVGAVRPGDNLAAGATQYGVSRTRRYSGPGRHRSCAPGLRGFTTNVRIQDSRQLPHTSAAARAACGA